MKRRAMVKNKILDKLHRGFVYTCMAATLLAGTELVFRFYRYYTSTKPQIDQKKLLEHNELLSEGASEDKAPVISS